MTLKDYLNEGDRFAANSGAKLVEIGRGTAKAEMTVTEGHLNAGGVCQGGSIFTLADLVFAAIVNQFGVGGAQSYLRHIRQTLGVGEAAVFTDLTALHQAVHDTVSYGHAWVGVRDKCYAYIEALGWDLGGSAAASQCLGADRLLAQPREREPALWRLWGVVLAGLLRWSSLLQGS